MELPADFETDPGILELESKIGVRPEFFRDLLKEDDWSFVIKLHALFEAACTHLLMFHFREPELGELFQRMDLSSRPIGKVAFLAKLELLGKEKRRFIAELSELRNSLVHDVRNAEFSLADMVRTLDPNARKRMAISFSPYESFLRRANVFGGGLVDDKALQDQAEVRSVVARFEAEPKFHLWFGAHFVLTSIVEMYGYSNYRQWARAQEISDDDLDDLLA